MCTMMITTSETTPLVSIGMPTYNGEKTIRIALDLLLAQDFKDFELIISDNASTDNTGNICQHYAARDPRIRYYRNEMNIEGENFHRVLHLARGKYFMWAADDDLWEPSYVSCMVEVLDSNPDAVLSFCRFDIIYADKRTLIEDNWSKIIGLGRFSRLLFSSCSLGKWAVNAHYIYGLYRKEILLNCGGMERRVDGSAGADVVTLFHLLYYGKFVRVDKLLHHHRYNYDRQIKPPLAQRFASQSIPSLAKSYLNWLSMMHQHYHMMRFYCKETSLQAPHKVILITTLFIAEIWFYLSNVSQTLLFSVSQYLRNNVK